MTAPTPNLANVQPVPGLPDFRWNATAGRYIAPNGQFVPVSMIRAGLNDFMLSVTDEMAVVSRSLVAGELTLAQWEARMLVLVKDANLAGAAVESGGWFAMKASEFGRAGAIIRGEYGFLHDFAKEIAAGTQKLDGTLIRRAQLYGQRGRSTYYDFAKVRAIESGFDENRSILTPADHCEKCVSEAEKGFQPIGKMIPIGQRTCRTNCRCYVEYRNSRTGETKVV